MKKTSSAISAMTLKQFRSNLEKGVIQITLDRRVIFRAVRKVKETPSMKEIDYTEFKRCDKKQLEAMFIENEDLIIKVVANRYKHKVCYLKK